MAISLLAGWLAHYDPIHRGWTIAGIANGVCATNGFCFARIRGGYNLRRTRDGESAVELVGAAGADARTVTTFPWVRHEAGAGYTYRLAAVGGGGVENNFLEVSARASFDAQGEWRGPRPNAPSDLNVTPIGGGRFLLRWVYSEGSQQVAPAEFRVYRGIGWSGVDYGQAVAVVPYRAGRPHGNWISQPFAHGTRVVWAVRAASAAGVEEDNARTAWGWSIALPPPINPTIIVRCVEDRRDRG